MWKTLFEKGEISYTGSRSDSRFYRLSKKSRKYLEKYESFDNIKGSIVQELKIKIAKQKGLLNQSEIIKFLERSGREKEIEVGEDSEIDCGEVVRGRW